MSVKPLLLDLIDAASSDSITVRVVSAQPQYWYSSHLNSQFRVRRVRRQILGHHCSVSFYEVLDCDRFADVIMPSDCVVVPVKG